MKLTDYLFHTPWWLPTIVMAVGAVLFYTANKRQEVRLRTIGLAVVCLGILIAVVSYVVDTDLEKAEKNTRRLVDAVEKKDWATVRTLLSPGTSLTLLDGSTLYRGGDTIADRAQQATDRYGIKELHVTGQQSRQDQTLITISMTVVSMQEATMLRPVSSTWEFDWQESADGWHLAEIRAVEVAGQRGQSIDHLFPGVRTPR